MPVAIRIERLAVRSLDIAQLEVTWETDSSQFDVLDYSFQVLRSESSEGPFDPLTAAFEDRYIFVDRRVPNSYRFRQFWYKIRVRRKATDEYVDFGPATQAAEADLVASTIRRNEQTVFTQAIGRMCWLLPRRTFGARCCNCWDDSISARKRSTCGECFDTSFVRGYLNPIEIWVQVDPVKKAVQIQQNQQNQKQFTTARMTFYPVVKPGDLLIEAENLRWMVTEVDNSERLRAVVKQNLTLGSIMPTDIEFNIPLRLSEALKDIQPSPGRMFTNPHNFDNAVLEKTPNIFANYPTLPDLPEE